MKGHFRTWAKALLAVAALAAAVGLAPQAGAQVRTREPNSEYARRRAALRAGADAPIVIFGFTGRENANPAYVFNQENNFYYLTGHNEEGAALVLLPDSAGAAEAKETLYLPPHNRATERWGGIHMSWDDADAREKTGFDAVRSFEALSADLSILAKTFPTFYTLLPGQNDAGYPHLKNWQTWLTEKVKDVKLADIGPKVGAMRQIKSAGEIELLTRAIEISVDAQLAAMKMMAPGLYEYQVAARMEEIHFAGGCETEAYAPIVGTGFNSTVLHYDTIGARIQDGDVVVLDVGGQYSGYAADITRTLPANGKFTARQREIYDIVYGAQQAALAAVKPGMVLTRGAETLYRIAYDYINTHGKDLHGQPLGKYFIHGLGHHIGLDVHDAGDPARPLAPGMVITIEPGIYIPEEKLGVRIEDDVLVTATGYKLLTARLPRTAEEIEKAMAAPRTSGRERMPEAPAAALPKEKAARPR